MASAGGRYVIVFNGEIYNFLDLRRELESTGGPREFKGHSDTEVMLACFEQWGVAASLPRFNGMFAFAVWDRRERTLHLARDPLGEKPLYYSWAADVLLFGSELKALRAHPDCPGEIDRGVLSTYLSRGYVPAPYSIYSRIFKLPPGTLLSVKGASRPSRVTRYWSFKEVAGRGSAHPFRGTAEDAESHLEHLLADAVRIRMIADVPLGAFLSGGIDSSVVVSLMQSASAKPVRTFTIGFHEGQFNEAAAARDVARYLHTDHTEWYITPREARAVVPRLPALYDEPFADSSQIPTFLVSSMARQQVTVSLSGDGGDELFGGYGRYARVSRLWRRLSLLPAAERRLIARAFYAITRRHEAGSLTGLALLPHRFAERRLRRMAALAPIADPTAFYLAHCAHWTGNSGAPVRGAAAAAAPPADCEEWAESDDLLERMMAVDTVTYLPDDILVKVDRAAMGVSLESRIPLLDRRVVEFAWRLPRNMRMRGGQSKWMLRRILYRHVPRGLVERPKRGFAVPVAAWIRGPLRDWAEALLDARRIDREGYLESAPIRRRWHDHLAGSEDYSDSLWAVLMFQAWLESETGKTMASTGVAASPAVC